MEILISAVGSETEHAIAVPPRFDSTRGHGCPFRVIEKRSVGWQALQDATSMLLVGLAKDKSHKTRQAPSHETGQ